MQEIKIIIAIIIISCFFYFWFLYVLSLFNSFRYKVPQVGTFQSDFKVMKKWLQKYNLSWKKMVDLWCGTGKVLRFFEKNFWMIATWYEIDRSNIIIAKILNFLYQQNTKVVRKDYFTIELWEYDVVYVYLYPILMDQIQKKIWGEAKNGTLVISNAFQFSNKIPIEILCDKNGKQEVFIYEI